MDYQESKFRQLFCLECGADIPYGRIDRKFCSPQCKNRFHNKKYSFNRSNIRRVTNALERNYEILLKLIKCNVTTLSLGDLALMGFNKEYVTSVRKEKGHNEYRCFDIKYICSETRIFSLERVKEINP